jgi:hypothetical protein
MAKVRMPSSRGLLAIIGSVASTAELPLTIEGDGVSFRIADAPWFAIRAVVTCGGDVIKARCT